MMMKLLPNAFLRPSPTSGSHLVLLSPAVHRTTGPILELGCGWYSTPYLHWVCCREKRPLTTYENSPLFMPFLEAFRADYHEVALVDYSQVDLSGSYSVVLVDQLPKESRRETICRLTHVEYVVVHDTHSHRRARREYGFDQVWDLFKYRIDSGPYPGVSVVSNVHDVAEILA
jgi:hypothetical protein